MKSRLLAFPFSVLMLSAASLPVRAQVNTWQGGISAAGTDNDWNVTAN